jgi:adenylyltransferase/sulfurtransferase
MFSEQDFKTLLDSEDRVKIIDVRPRTEFGICQLTGSTSMTYFLAQTINSLRYPAPDVPLNDLVANPASYLEAADEAVPLFVVCRLGNDSQIAAEALRGVRSGLVKDVIGGLRAWSTLVDSGFPIY